MTHWTLVELGSDYYTCLWKVLYLCFITSTEEVMFFAGLSVWGQDKSKCTECYFQRLLVMAQGGSGWIIVVTQVRMEIQDFFKQVVNSAG